ncbi:MAG: hypothetical protein PHP17_07405 [Candidatus Omnitrophica bacterium]|nr:hypothetical protein [Candidatus Omnitrophota bacterium]
MNLNIAILIILMVAALWTTMTRSLLRAAIGLAFMSLALTLIMFRLNSGLAAVFELSVCAGLIPVLFVSTISLTHPLTKQEVMQHMKDRIRRFWYLPLIIVIAGIALSFITVTLNIKLPPKEAEESVRAVLWNGRPLYLVGQIIVLLAGAFGVVILFKESEEK